MAQDKRPTAGISADNPFAPLMQMQTAGLGGFLQLNAAWVESLGDIGAEVTSFLAERIKEDVKTQHALLHCKDMNEAREIQARFIQKAIDQYQAETGKLVEMGMTAFAPQKGGKPS